jgi:Flp pilus assembly protein TadD
MAFGRHADAVDALRALVGGGSPACARADVLSMLGRALLALGRSEEAEESLRAALAAEPEDPDALGALAAVLLRRGDATAALETGLRAAALRMGDPTIHLTVGRAFAALGEHREAVVAFEACVAQAPGWTEAAEELATARQRASGAV